MKIPWQMLVQSGICGNYKNKPKLILVCKNSLYELEVWEMAQHSMKLDCRGSEKYKSKKPKSSSDIHLAKSLSPGSGHHGNCLCLKLEAISI